MLVNDEATLDVAYKGHLGGNNGRRGLALKLEVARTKGSLVIIILFLSFFLIITLDSPTTW